MTTNYAALVQAIKDTAEDDGAEFEAFIPIAIGLAEDRLFNELDLPDIETKITGSISAETLPKPVGYSYVNYLNLIQNNRKIKLKSRSEEFINDYWPDPSTTDVPKYYADSGLSTFTIAPTPDALYNYELKYGKEPNRLTSSNQTNYYTDYCDNILYAATMIEMAKFMKAFTQVPIWEESYLTKASDWNMLMSRRRRDSGEAPRNQSGPNTIKHTMNSNA